MPEGPSLEHLGWTADREAEMAPFAARGLEPARVSLEHNHVYRVVGAAGEQLAEASGRLKHEAAARQALPAVGDWVAIRPNAAGPRVQIAAVLPRRTWFSRQAAGRETGEQIVAANLDTVLVTFGLDRPVKARAIERYLVVARRGGAVPAVVLNKADVADDLDAALAEARAAAGDVDVLVVSSRTGTGVEAIEARLAPGRTMAFIGPSGAGKSSIVNQLLGSEALPTGDVRGWDARGRHTSVHRQMLVRERGGVIIDTPGMRELQLWEPAGVADAFADIEALAADCRFRDCRHDREPGCAVKAAVEAGRLDADRHEHFLRLRAEQDEIARRRTEDARRRGGG
jgi:ribosome biogenesis GTPase